MSNARTQGKNQSVRHVNQFGLVLVVLSCVTVGTVPISAVPANITVGTTYTQDFDTLANTGTSSTVPTGWAFVESLNHADGLYTANDGSSTTDDTYSYGTG